MKNNLYTIILFSIFAFACADGLGDDDCLFGATAECSDGTYSYSNSRSGTCSHHGGVSYWCGGQRASQSSSPDPIVNSTICYVAGDIFHSYSYCCSENTGECSWSGTPECGDGLRTHNEECDGGNSCSSTCELQTNELQTNVSPPEPLPSYACREQNADARGRCHGNNLIYCDPTGVPRTVVCNSPDLTRRCGIDVENDMFDCLQGL